MPRIKLLAVDLDGTLLGSDRQPNPESAAALRDCIDHGVRVVLASGRICTTVRPFAESLGIAPLMVCCNGAHVLAEDGTEILHNPLLGIAAKRLYDFGVARRIHINLYLRGAIHNTGPSEWGDVYLSRAKPEVVETIDPDRIEADPPTKMMFVAAGDTIAQIKPEADALASTLGVRTTLSEPEYLEFLQPSADKGTGLAAVASYLGIAQNEVSAIGDYSNDVEMLLWAGLSAAMGNGNDDAKQAAKVVVGTNDEAGVAQFVRRFVLV